MSRISRACACGMALAALCIVLVLPERNVVSLAYVTRTASPVFPLKASASGRYLVDQNNTPFLMTGDAAWAIPYNLSTSDAQTYLSTRAAQGFNTVLMTVLDNSYGSGRSDYSTFDGILPFTTPNDLSTPNPAYFARLDQDVQLAHQHNMAVILLPIDAGGSMPLLRSNGLAKARAFGVYLGNRYRAFSNVLWTSGVDFQTWRTQSDDQLQQAVAQGIASVAPQQMQTVELNFLKSASRDDPTWSPPVNLDWVYDSYPPYDEALHEYNLSPPMPLFLGESNYEGENNSGMNPSTPLVLRQQEWWTALSGATGELFGNHYTWQFLAGWQNNVNTTGAAQFIMMSNLMAGLSWWSLVPDQNHTVVTAGYGTYNATGSYSNENYVTTAATPDGTLALSYLPVNTTLTVNMAKLAGPVTAQWFDPTTGTYSTISGSPFNNGGTRQFTSPGPNAGGDADWVLVLMAHSAAPTVTPLPTNTPVVAPTPTATPPAFVLGHATVGNSQDTGNQNWLVASRYRMPDRSGTVSYMAMAVGPVDAAPRNKAEVAIYGDNNGQPGTLIATSASTTLTPNSWVGFILTPQPGKSLTLAANAWYWLAANENSSVAADNAMKVDWISEQSDWMQEPYGIWPTTWTPSGSDPNTKWSIFVTLK